MNKYQYFLGFFFFFFNVNMKLSFICKKIVIYDACIYIVPFQSCINFERGQNSQTQSLYLNMINQSFNCYLFLKICHAEKNIRILLKLEIKQQFKYGMLVLTYQSECLGPRISSITEEKMS